MANDLRLLQHLLDGQGLPVRGSLVDTRHLLRKFLLVRVQLLLPSWHWMLLVLRLRLLGR